MLSRYLTIRILNEFIKITITNKYGIEFNYVIYILSLVCKEWTSSLLVKLEFNDEVIVRYPYETDYFMRWLKRGLKLKLRVLANDYCGGLSDGNEKRMIILINYLNSVNPFRDPLFPHKPIENFFTQYWYEVLLNLDPDGVMELNCNIMGLDHDVDTQIRRIVNYNPHYRIMDDYGERVFKGIKITPKNQQEMGRIIEAAKRFKVQHLDIKVMDLYQRITTERLTHLTLDVSPSSESLDIDIYNDILVTCKLLKTFSFTYRQIQLQGGRKTLFSQELISHENITELSIKSINEGENINCLLEYLNLNTVLRRLKVHLNSVIPSKDFTVNTPFVNNTTLETLDMGYSESNLKVLQRWQSKSMISSIGIKYPLINDLSSLLIDHHSNIRSLECNLYDGLAGKIGLVLEANLPLLEKFTLVRGPPHTQENFDLVVKSFSSNKVISHLGIIDFSSDQFYLPFIQLNKPNLESLYLKESREYSNLSNAMKSNDYITSLSISDKSYVQRIADDFLQTIFENPRIRAASLQSKLFLKKDLTEPYLAKVTDYITKSPNPIPPGHLYIQDLFTSDSHYKILLKSLQISSPPPFVAKKKEPKKKLTFNLFSKLFNK